MSDRTKGVGFRDKKNKPLHLKTNHILAIGVDMYEKPQSRLYNPVDDCKKIIKILCEKYRFEKENVNTLFNEKATRDNIINMLWKYRDLTDDDNLIILFSGHGDYDKPSDVGFWIPVNASGPAQYITKADVMMQLKAFKAHHVALIIDSCFSGAMTRNKQQDPVKDNQNYLASIRSFKKKSRWAMTSGRVELVYDGNAGENSPFASSMLSELETNDKGMLLFSELGTAVRKITNRNANQDPSCKYLSDVGDMDGEFSFILKDYIPLEGVVEKKSEGTKEAAPLSEPISSPPQNAKKELPKPEPQLNDLKSIKKQLRKWSTEDNLKKAYEYLIEHLKEDASPKSMVYNRLGGWTRLQKEINTGMISKENANVSLAQHRGAIDYIITELSEEDFENLT